jgi:hypothetical protein
VNVSGALLLQTGAGSPGVMSPSGNVCGFASDGTNKEAKIAMTIFIEASACSFCTLHKKISANPDKYKAGWVM